ncbi:aminopeptidase N [Calidifontibacter terrae]
MSADLNLTWQECDARGDQITVTAARVELDLTTAPTESATFTSRTTLVFDSTGPATWIDLVADEIEAVELNGAAIEPAYDGARLLLHDLAGHNTVIVTARCRFSRTGEGMHRFLDPQDGRTYLYTHCEPTDARRIFACFEQPDLKARWTMVVTAPRDWEIRSNQPEVAREENSATDAATATFAPTPPLSSYLVAVAAGPYHRVDSEWISDDGQQVPLTLLCRRGMADHLESEEIFELTTAGLGFYDANFGFAYPWGKYDQIFVPEYNLGAMENPGLVTFKEDYLFRGGATVMNRTSRAEVVLHEMAHMWFGDLVTPQWWDDLWLKESFADLMGYQVSQEATRFDQAWLQFASGRKAFAYRFDQMPTTHPVIANIPDLEAARQNFDGITYAKGASVLRQLQEFIGRDAFFAGARDYFAAHAFGTARFTDLLAALATHTDADLDQWAKVWLHTTYPSRLTATVERDGAQITALTLEQSSVGDVIRPHRMRVAGHVVKAGRLEQTFDELVLLEGPTAMLPAAVGKSADLVIVNAGDLTYGISRLDERSRATAEQHLSTLGDDLQRGAVWTALWNQARDAQIPPADFVRIFRAQAPTEPNAMILRIIAGQAQTAIGSYLLAADRAAAWSALGATARDALAVAAPDSDLQRIWAEILAEAAAHSDTITDDALALAAGKGPQGLEVNAELRWQLAASLVRIGRWGADDVRAVLADDDTMIGHTSSLTAYAADPATQQQSWDELVAADKLSNDHQRATLAGFALSHPGTRFVADYVALLDTVWQGRPQSMAQRLVTGLFPQVDADAAGDAAVAAVNGWLDAHPVAPRALRRVVIEAVDNAERAQRAQRVSG